MALSKRLRSLFFPLGIIILAIASCIGAILLFVELITTGFWGWPYDGIRRNYVDQEVSKTVESLPELEQLDLLAIYHETFSSHIHVPKKLQAELKQKGVPPCYYSRAYLIYGTQLPEPEVIDLYVEHLTPLGWRFTTSTYDDLISRGDGESINVSQAGEWSFFYREVGFNYDEMKRVYAQLVLVSVQYTWPKRTGC